MEENYGLLFRFANILFEGKAANWYWRYQRSVTFIKWSALRSALRAQYEGVRSDINYREVIQDRKQSPGKKFDCLLLELSGKLTQPLTEEIIVEVVRRN